MNLRVAGGNIALHLNARLKERVFVRNSFLSECWGPEETKMAAAFPFSAGTYFEVTRRRPSARLTTLKVVYGSSDFE